MLCKLCKIPKVKFTLSNLKVCHKKCSIYYSKVYFQFFVTIYVIRIRKFSLFYKVRNLKKKNKFNNFNTLNFRTLMVRYVAKEQTFLHFATGKKKFFTRFDNYYFFKPNESFKNRNFIDPKRVE